MEETIVESVEVDEVVVVLAVVAGDLAGLGGVEGEEGGVVAAGLVEVVCGGVHRLGIEFKEN